MKKVFKIILVLMLVGGPIPSYGAILSSAEASTAQVVTFHDLKGHWAKAEIEILAGKGVISGYPDGTFKPSLTITKAQFSKILSGLMDVKSESLSFSSVKGHWSESYINGLVEIGVIEKDEYPHGYFPNEQITRIEMAKMLARALAKRKLTLGADY